MECSLSGSLKPQGSTNVMKQLFTISILVVFVLLWPSAAVACEQCLGIGGSNGPTIRALIFSMGGAAVHCEFRRSGDRHVFCPEPDYVSLSDG